MSARRPAELRRELDAQREELSTALEAMDPALLTAPGLVGDWSARELVAHLAHWNDWASTCLAAAAEDRLQELVTDTWDVDAQNAEVARQVASVPMSAVRDREADSYERLGDRLSALDPSLLSVPAPWGGTVEDIVIENGPGHYAQHVRHVRDWFASADEDEPDDDDDGPPAEHAAGR
ncbi:MAG: maleylpyruvate isomerase N-terminal domain-containing protein [Chloroflexi bacterium]|nr:maleylpyruvate isomerase N-terminal domain-containing protein [Chloroflexota bacterium]